MGCRSFEVVVKDDPFKGTSVITADMWHTVTDFRVFDNQRVLYEKEIKNGRVGTPTAFFLFNAIVIPMWGYNGEDLEQSAYIVCDNNKFKTNIIGYKKEIRTNVSGSGNTDASGNYHASVSTSRTSVITGKIALTPDIQNAISKCSKYMIRFYLTGGTNSPVTLEATPAQLDAVKKFIAANASNTVKK